MVCFALFCFVILSVTATSCGTKNTDNYYNGDDDQKMMMTTIKLLLAVFMLGTLMSSRTLKLSRDGF